MTLAVVCGMASEATIVGGQFPNAIVIVGAGNSASLAEKLDLHITKDNINRILSFGVAGALSSELQVGEIVIGVSVCDSIGTIIHSDQKWVNQLSYLLKEGSKPVDFPVSFVNFVSMDTPIATMAARTTLHDSTAADAVDMESYIAASAAKAHNLPFAIMRVVLDEADFNLPPAALVPFYPNGHIIKEPWQVPKLVQLAFWSEKAMGNLAVALAAIGRDL